MSTDNNATASQLHPIAAQAGSLFLQCKGSFDAEALEKLELELEKLHGRPELGPAVASLVQVAQYLDRERNAKNAAMALLQVAMAQTTALEALNEKARLAKEDESRKKQKAFSKFTGRN
jgi:hypothetical protein